MCVDLFTGLNHEIVWCGLGECEFDCSPPCLGYSAACCKKQYSSDPKCLSYISSLSFRTTAVIVSFNLIILITSKWVKWRTIGRQDSASVKWTRRTHLNNERLRKRWVQLDNNNFNAMVIDLLRWLENWNKSFVIMIIMNAQEHVTFVHVFLDQFSNQSHLDKVII